jgi:hydrogenase-4 component B
LTALTIVALVIAVLPILGAAAALLPRRSATVMVATAALSVLGALAVFIALLAGAGQGSLGIPLGLPRGTMLLVLDPLSGFFLLLLFVTATACAVFAVDAHGAEDLRSTPFFPVFLAAMAVTLLAGDAFGLVFGFELMSLASWAMVLSRHEDAASRDAALFYMGMAAFGAVCLVPAFALLAPVTPSGMDLRFAAIRAAPPEGWRAAAVLVLVLLGAGSKAGLAPLHVWLPLAHPAAPSHVSALMSGAMTKVALYVVIRMLLDLCGPVQPLWWGVPLLAMGAGSAVLGALRANMEPDLKTILASSTVENVGLIAVGIGVALIARAADLPGLAALALGAAMLHALNHGIFKTLLFLGAGAAQHGAGSRSLERLGGLIHQMPVTTCCVLVGCAGLAAVPPGPGFASEWLLFQSVLAAPRIGGLALQTTVVVVASLIALAAALAASASVRLVGIAFLGRPRSPRAAAAEEAGPPARWAMISLAVLTGVLGLLPGPALRLAEPAIRALAGSGLEGRANPLDLATLIGARGYAAPAVALLLAAMGGLTFVAVRRLTAPGYRRGPAWSCGFAAPPAWLPFGDPVTQYSGSSFAQPLARTLGTTLLAAREQVDMPGPADTRPARLVVQARDPAFRWLFSPLRRLREGLAAQADRIQFFTIRRTLSVIFAALVLFLAIVAWLEAP